MQDFAVHALFLDIGGVLMTNAWDHAARTRVADQYDLDRAELETLHQQVVDAFERGRLDLEGYLSHVVFYASRPFSREAFRATMLEQSTPYSDMIDLVRGLKSNGGLKVAVVSNESRELAEYRIRTFGLGSFVDCFVVSSFVGLRKPEAEFYRLALDLMQVAAERVAYVEDRPAFVEAAARLGFHAVHHTALSTTRAALTALTAVPRAPGSAKLD